MKLALILVLSVAMLYAAASMERRSPNEIFIEGSKYEKICEVSVHKLRWIRDYRMCSSNKTEQVNARNINCTQEFMPYNGMFVPSGCAHRIDNQKGYLALIRVSMVKELHVWES